jgi:exosortase/archaeosortase family protein
VATKPKHQHSIIPQTTVPLLTRTVVFLGIFILLSGLIGPRIISGGIQNRDGFGIYGGLGKACIFGALAFLLLAYRRGFNLKLQRWQPYNTIWLVLATLAFSGAWLGVTRLLRDAHHTHPLTAIATHILLLGSLVLAAGGVFGPANLRRLCKTYRRELAIAIGLGAAFYGFLALVYGLWPLLSAAVLHSVQALLGLLGLHSTEVPPRTLFFNKFGIEIAEYCSGIESIALFTGLYALVGVLDWPRLNHRKFLGAFLPGLIILFGCNILRVAGLIAAGYYINQHIAFSLFHTYAGMVFFIIYSIIFWALSYGWMLRD